MHAIGEKGERSANKMTSNFFNGGYSPDAPFEVIMHAKLPMTCEEAGRSDNEKGKKKRKR